jgi:hypothetical protein
MTSAIRCGQANFAWTLGELVRLVAPDLHRLLGPQHKDAFLEPLAFIHFSAGRRFQGLEQLLWGYLSDSSRPGWVSVETDKFGGFYIPRFGHVATGLKNCSLTFRAEFSCKESSHVEFGGQPIPLRFHRPRRIDGTSVVLLNENMELLGRCFPPSLPIESTRIPGCAAAHETELAKAAGLLRLAWPEVFGLLDEVVRYVVLFHASDCNSFATTEGHGIAFINTALGDSEIFFLEDFVHQGGHVLFSAATHDSGLLFGVPPVTPMSKLSGRIHDDRTVYVALHGLFTEALIARSLDRALESDLIEPAHLAEAMGRLAFILRKCGEDVVNFAKPGILSDTGASLFADLAKTWKDIMLRRKSMMHGIDLSNQEYNFSVSRYAATNSL